MFTPIIGTESELGNQGLNTGSFIRRVAEYASRIGRIPGIISGISFFGLNGCRLYPDCHSGMEYATPECVSPQQAVAYELGGPLLLSRLTTEIYGPELADGMWALKNNNPPIRHNEAESTYSYGNHINIQMPLRQLPGGDDLRANSNDYAASALALITTLPLICGAGILVQQPGAARLGGPGFSYRLSARSHYTATMLGTSATGTRTKPMILIRDEPLAHNRKYWRLQITSLDANILPAANLVKLTALQLTAEMWAAGLLEPVVLADPVMALRQFSSDWTSHLDVLGGSSLSALDIQYRYLRQAIRYVKSHNRTVYAAGLREWMRQLEAFRQTDGVPAALLGSNDWVTKYLLIQRRHAEFAQAQVMNVRYHSYRLGGSFESSQPQRLLTRFAPPGLLEQVRHSILAPPATRALARSRFIRAAIDTDAEVTVDWTWLNVTREGVSRGLKLYDPRQAVVHNLASLIQDMYDTRNAA